MKKLNNIRGGARMKKFKTEQEKFWSEEFGNEYITRNQNYLANIPLFSKILSKTMKVESVIELLPRPLTK